MRFQPLYLTENMYLHESKHLFTNNIRFVFVHYIESYPKILYTFWLSVTENIHTENTFVRLILWKQKMSSVIQKMFLMMGDGFD